MFWPQEITFFVEGKKKKKSVQVQSHTKSCHVKLVLFAKKKTSPSLQRGGGEGKVVQGGTQGETAESYLVSNGTESRCDY